jgi:(2Fe-2S) ferredoxin
MAKSTKKTGFAVQGQLLYCCVHPSGRVKAIQVEDSQGLQVVKLSKRVDWAPLLNLAPGDWVQVVGEQQVKANPLRIKRKAIAVIPVPTEDLPCQGPIEQGNGRRPIVGHRACQLNCPGELPLPTAPIKIGVCHKSSCCKRGANSVWKALEDSLRRQGLEDQVTLQRTKCLGKCNAGPAVLIMPSKTRYTQVNPKQVEALVHQCLFS